MHHLSIIKGIHPGLYLERELKKRHISKGRFAISINEYPQTLVSITKCNRRMNVPLAMRIENALGLEEGILMTLQVYHDIENEKKKNTALSHPDLSKIRKILFWDTEFEKINWQKQKRAIVKRVFEKGNEEEREEIRQFYGAEMVDQLLKNE